MEPTLEGGQIGKAPTVAEDVKHSTGKVGYRETGDGEYAMFGPILKQDTLLQTGLIAVSSKENDLIYRVAVCPQNLTSASTTTRINYLSKLFRYWQGSTKFKFVSTKAIFQQLKLIMYFIPNGTESQDTNMSMAERVGLQNHVIFNPDNNACVELDCPFWTTGVKHTIDQPTGIFGIRVFQPMVVTQPAEANELPWTLMVRSEDMTFWYSQLPTGPSGSANPTGNAQANYIGPRSAAGPVQKTLPLAQEPPSVDNAQSIAIIPVPVLENIIEQDSLPKSSPSMTTKTMEGEQHGPIAYTYADQLTNLFARNYTKVAGEINLAPGKYFSAPPTTTFAVANSSDFQPTATFAKCYLTFADATKPEQTGCSEGTLELQFDPSFMESYAVFTMRNLDGVPATENLQIFSLTVKGTAGDSTAYTKIVSDAENLIEDENITHFVAFSPRPAAVLNNELQSFILNPETADFPADTALQHGKQAGFYQDAIAPNAADSGFEDDDNLKVTFLPFIGPIFDLVSGVLPDLAGTALNALGSVFGGADPLLNTKQQYREAKKKLSTQAYRQMLANDTFVFTVDPDGDDITYKYNSTVKANELQKHAAKMRKLHGKKMRNLCTTQRKKLENEFTVLQMKHQQFISSRISPKLNPN